jgi:DHA1 family bicyclomycin/chloramphenicol resistance-like MFS transporter
LAVFALGQLIAGPLSDRFGRRAVLLGGLGLFLAGSAVGLAAHDLPTLLVGRVLQGLGAAAASALSRAVARDLIEGPALAHALGWVLAIMSAAPGFSPLLGAIVGDAFGWRATFATLFALGIVALAGYLVTIGESLPPTRRAHRRLGALARDYARLLADPAFARPALSGALTMGGLFALFGATPAILRKHFGIGTLGIGLFFAAVVFAVFAAANRGPRWAARVGLEGVVRIGVALCLIAGGAVAVIGFAATPSLAAYVVATALFLFGIGLVTPTSTALALSPFASMAGQASALLGCLQMTAATVALGALGWAPAGALGALAGVVVVVSLLALALQLRAPSVASATG